ncbi:YihY/virulence factor BrkB family protein [Nocardioides sp. MAHUQ-72]|uniref:YihY/virulence factor BrkB family protein n=1 Tax=unclassified Nocardioides TaxID=2615069 RepID=UPI00361EC2DB
MPSLKQRVAARLAAVRARRPLVDHAVRTQEHYGAVKAAQQAGAVTYFGFLSFFPILALSFFVVGWIAKVYDGARGDLRRALNSVMPGLVGTGDNQVQIHDIEAAAATLGAVGAVILLYSGLGWLAAMRDALVVVFEVPAREQPSFLLGKLRDLATLALIGLILLLSVAVAGLVGGFSQDLLEWVGLGSELDWLVKLLTVVLGFAANMLLFFTMFVLLAEPRTPRRSLWSGALLGAVAFEALKQVSGLLIRSAQGNPAFQAFGIALIVLVWINYFSRVVLYAAAWAHTSAAARAQRVAEPAAPLQGPQTPALTEVTRSEAAASADVPSTEVATGTTSSGATSSGATRAGWVVPFAAGGATALAAVAVLRNRPSKDDS